MSDKPRSEYAPDQPDSYVVPAAEGTAEFKVQRSRFLAVALYAEGEAAARSAITAATQKYHDARHVCHAWRLGAPPTVHEARADAGEPSGTAGEPILSAIRKSGLSDAVVVVARWFGGVKLGTGGLARAYGQTAEEALATAGRRTILLGREFELVFPYALQKSVDRLLSAQGGRVLSDAYGADVVWRIWLPHSAWRAFADGLRERTADRIQLSACRPEESELRDPD